MSSITFTEQMLGSDEIVIMYNSIITIEYHDYVSKIGIHLINNFVVWINLYESGREMTSNERQNAKESISKAQRGLKNFLKEPTNNREIELELFVSIILCREKTDS